MKHFLVILLGLVSLLVEARVYEEGPIYPIVIDAHDGDTIKVNIKEWPSIIGEGIRVRLKGINTNEVGSGYTAEEAKLAVETKIKEGKVIELRKISRDKYFRLLDELWVDGVNISDYLIAKGLAKKWNGQGEKPTTDTKPTTREGEK